MTIHNWMTRAVMMLITVIIMSTAGPAFSQSSMSISDIKAELSRLRVLYTEEHPDVQRLVRHLKKAEELKKERVEIKQKAEPEKTAKSDPVKSTGVKGGPDQGPAKKWVTQ